MRVDLDEKNVEMFHLKQHNDFGMANEEIKYFSVSRITRTLELAFRFTRARIYILEFFVQQFREFWVFFAFELFKGARYIDISFIAIVLDIEVWNIEYG